MEKEMGQFCERGRGGGDIHILYFEGGGLPWAICGEKSGLMYVMGGRKHNQ